MILGYSAGNSPLHRAHPFTPATAGFAVSVLAFALPGPVGPLVLAVGVVVAVIASRLGQVLVTAFWMSLPFWTFIVVIHVVIGDSPERALTLGMRITAILVAFLAVLAVVHPSRLVDALVERGVPFAFAYLLSATLQAVPRLRERALGILDAQRCRGLRVRGSLWRRARAVVPLAIPLILGALAEVDERAFALEARGAGSVRRRTSLDPPRDTVLERSLRWLMVVGAVAAVVARIAS